MVLSKELIDIIEKEVHVKELFQESNEVTANHILFKCFNEKSKYPNLPKLIFYIIMENGFGAPSKKDSNGDLAYALEFKPVKQ